MRYLPVLLLVGAVAACRSGSPAAHAPSALVAPPDQPCTVSLNGVDVSSWRHVTARGFTFCVPADWRPSGNGWRRGTTTIEWGLGEPPQRTSTQVAVIAAGAPRRPPGPPANSNIRRFSERIDGRQVDLWNNRFGSEYYTGARFSSPSVYLVGDASDHASAELTIQIYRTVRFVAP